MTEAYRRYLKLVDSLREMRRDGAPEPELRPILGDLEDLFAELSPEEQDTANTEGWRGWPDQYDDHMESLVETDTEIG
jgi:hypothetical protein